MNKNLYSFDEIRDLVIGTVESVSPAKIEIALETSSPQNTAINTGVPVQFPKINGYVIIPNEAGALIGQITWTGVHYSNYPKRKGFKDFDLIDLPFPIRKMSITPLGVLKKKREAVYEVERGVYSYPSIGDTVILPTQTQLKAIAENNEEEAFVKIGTCPLAGNAPVRINPDKLFGRHVAVLGNTGSGKSCSVAGMVRWSLEEADKRKKSKGLNARFILLDPNGEYKCAFEGLGNKINRVKVVLDNERMDGINQLRVPLWMWNSYEWSSITGASSRAQRPILRQALRLIKGSLDRKEDDTLVLKQYFFRVKTEIKTWLNEHRYKSKATSVGKHLETVGVDCTNKKTDFPDFEQEIVAIQNALRKPLTNRKKQTPDNKDHYYVSFTEEEIKTILESIEEILEKIGGPDIIKGPNEDTPIRIESDEHIPDLITELAREQNSEQFLEYLVTRIRTMLSDERIASIIQSKDSPDLFSWLVSYLGSTDEGQHPKISIIDLSLVPQEIIHLVIGVISRIIFEATQRFKKIHETELPTVVVLEEAHTFLRKYNENNEEISASRLCCQSFERIAREGRKFGLGLMLSSQRPSELSPTVLSQCNTFLLHRIVNDKDQQYVRSLIPDSMGGLLDELPVLPSRKAILTGWAAPIPVLVEMNYLPKEHQPDSQDPDFWKVWTGEKKVEVDWKQVVDDWQGNMGKMDVEKGEEE